MEQHYGQLVLICEVYKFRFVELIISDYYVNFKEKARWFRIKTIVLIWRSGRDLNPRALFRRLLP